MESSQLSLSEYIPHLNVKSKVRCMSYNDATDHKDLVHATYGVCALCKQP